MLLGANEAGSKNTVGWSGRLLVGFTGGFWFITCLFATQQVFNFLINTFAVGFLYGLAFLCLLLSYINEIFLPNLFLPWALEVTLGVLQFCTCGHHLRQANPEVQSSRLSAIAFVGLGLSLTNPHLFATRCCL